MEGKDVVTRLEGDLSPGGELGSVLEDIRQQDSQFAGTIKAGMDSAAADGRRAAEALLDAGASPQQALDEGYRVAGEQLGELLLNLYGHRERLNRETDLLDSLVDELTEWYVDRFHREMKQFLAEQFLQMRREYEKRYEWHTGLKDGMKMLRAKIYALGGNTAASPSTETRPLLEQLVDEYLSKEKITSFVKQLDTSLQKHVTERWSQTTANVLRDALVAARGSASAWSHPLNLALESELDIASKSALAGLAAAGASTVMLAAGWHTLAWAISGIFAPMLLAGIALTLFAAMLGRDRTVSKVQKKLLEQEEKSTREMKENMLPRMRIEVESANRKTAANLKEFVFHKVVGKFQPRLLDRLIQHLEKHLENIGSAVGGGESLTATNSCGQWLSRARESLARDDEISAALFGCLAFEQRLRELNRSLELGFDFRRPHHNRAFIDTLANTKKVKPDTISKLRSLKSRRDMFTHRMHLVVTSSVGKRRKQVARFLKDLEQSAAL